VRKRGWVEVECAFCGRRFRMPGKRERGAHYLCPECAEKFEREA